jgi:hypothetical protein
LINVTFYINVVAGVDVLGVLLTLGFDVTNPRCQRAHRIGVNLIFGVDMVCGVNVTLYIDNILGVDVNLGAGY